MSWQVLRLRSMAAATVLLLMASLFVSSSGTAFAARSLEKGSKTSLLHRSSSSASSSSSKLAYDPPPDPKETLCPYEEETWCPDWVDCIHDCATPEGTQAKVLECWDPAECEEYCGIWPVTSGASFMEESPSNSKATSPRGFDVEAVRRFLVAEEKAALGMPPAGHRQRMIHPSNSSSAVAKIISPLLLNRISNGGGTRKDCMESCENVQSSLSECVATIIFEPGQVATMGPTERPAYTGGCMAQLHAYQQATDPSQGSGALPGPNGCSPHD